MYSGSNPLGASKTPFNKGFFVFAKKFIFASMIGFINSFLCANLIFLPESTEVTILKFTLAPLFAWLFLWGYDKLEHIFLHNYFEWTLKDERPKKTLLFSLKKLFESLSASDFKSAQKHLKAISQSNLLKFAIAYLIGVGLVQTVQYTWLNINMKSFS